MKILKLILLILILPINSYSSELKIACAANFILPMKELSKNFEHEKKIKVINTFGSTGMLFGQIKNGAPFDIFFAADMKRPEMLVDFKKVDSVFEYAKGKAVLWSVTRQFSTPEDVIKNSKKISIALPRAAPYGDVVIEYLTKKGIYEDTKPKLVFGKNVAQSFQYAFSGYTDSGFCALSQALSDKGKKGRYFLLKGSDTIIQGGCILNNEVLANLFLNYLLESEEILKRYGYESIN